MWKDIDSKYEVSNLGYVRNKTTGHVLKLFEGNKVVLLYNDKKKVKRLNNLVWDYFGSEPRGNRHVSLCSGKVKHLFGIKNLKLRKDYTIPASTKLREKGAMSVKLAVDTNARNFNKLLDVGYCKKEGDNLFNWLTDNCPSGIFDVLSENIINYKKRISGGTF